MSTRPSVVPPSRGPVPGRGAAFTLVEVMVAVALFTVCLGIFFSVYGLGLTLTIKNVSINDSAAGLQTTFGRTFSTLENASSLVDCANYDPATAKFTAVADGTWGNAVRYLTLLPVTGYILPDDNSGYRVDNPPPSTRLTYLQTGSSTVRISFNAALYPPASFGVPTSTRLIPAFPVSGETVAVGASPGYKPGLGVATFTLTGGTGRATVTLANPMPARSVSDCTRAYLAVEGALAVVPEYVGGPRRLLRFDDAVDPTKFVVVCRSLDDAAQVPPDAPGTTTMGCFRHPAGGVAVQALLPIRSRDFSNAVSLSGRGGKAAATNVWIRLSPQFRLRQTL